jgi:hypothetical protein
MQRQLYHLSTDENHVSASSDPEGHPFAWSLLLYATVALCALLLLLALRI